MKAVVLYGNPKTGGFVHGCLDFVAERLEERGAEAERVRLVERDVGECTGCFTCLREGRCPLEDDMGAIIDSLRAADGIVVGASVRNGYFPALFKRFFERATYLLGFSQDLRGKPVLAVGAVGMAGGRKHLGKLITLSGFMTVPTDYLFFRTGIPGKLAVAAAADRLRPAADRFFRRMEKPARPPLVRRMQWALDTAVVRRFMLKKNPEGVYDWVIGVWKRKGLM